MHFLFFLSLAFACLVKADFYVYEYATSFIAGIKFHSSPTPTCLDLGHAHEWYFSSDVSGDKQGCRIVRGSDRKAAPEVLECNTDFGHLSKLFSLRSSYRFPELQTNLAITAIYKDRNWGVFDLEDKQHGNCQPYTDYTFDCGAGIMGDNKGQSIFHCNTDIGTG